MARLARRFSGKRSTLIFAILGLYCTVGPALLPVIMKVLWLRHAARTEAILDSQSVPTDTHSDSAALGGAAIVGFDAAKKVKGRKRHMTVDTLGLVLRVLVTAADVPEREGGQRVLENVKQMGPYCQPSLFGLGRWGWSAVILLCNGRWIPCAW